MSVKSAKALVKLNQLVEKDKVIHINQMFDGIEVTVFDNDGSGNHRHYDGKDLISAIEKIDE